MQNKSGGLWTYIEAKIRLIQWNHLSKQNRSSPFKENWARRELHYDRRMFKTGYKPPMASKRPKQYIYENKTDKDPKSFTSKPPLTDIVHFGPLHIVVSLPVLKCIS